MGEKLRQCFCYLSKQYYVEFIFIWRAASSSTTLGRSTRPAGVTRSGSSNGCRRPCWPPSSRRRASPYLSWATPGHLSGLQPPYPAPGNLSFFVIISFCMFTWLGCTLYRLLYIDYFTFQKWNINWTSQTFFWRATGLARNLCEQNKNNPKWAEKGNVNLPGGRTTLIGSSVSNGSLSPTSFRANTRT